MNILILIIDIEKVNKLMIIWVCKDDILILKWKDIIESSICSSVFSEVGMFLKLLIVELMVRYKYDVNVIR